jgi:hypothetical protein
LIPAERLRRFLGWLRALHHNGLKRGSQELGIMAVGPSDGCAQRTAIRFYD